MAFSHVHDVAMNNLGYIIVMGSLLTAAFYSFALIKNFVCIPEYANIS